MNTNPTEENETSTQRGMSIMELINQSVGTLMIEDSKATETSISESNEPSFEVTEKL